MDQCQLPQTLRLSVTRTQSMYARLTKHTHRRPNSHLTSCVHPLPLHPTQLIQLRPNIRIPDFGELNWPIHVPDSYQVADAKVSLTGLYHPHASDLR